MFLCDCDPNEVLTTRTDSKGEYAPGIYFFYDGPVRVFRGGTQEELAQFDSPNFSPTSGLFSQYGEGEIDCHFEHGAKWVCIPRKHNIKLPQIEHIELNENSTMQGENGGKYFVVSGSVVVNGKVIHETKRFRLTDEYTITALTNTQILKIS